MLGILGILGCAGLFIAIVGIAVSTGLAIYQGDQQKKAMEDAKQLQEDNNRDLKNQANFQKKLSSEIRKRNTARMQVQLGTQLAKNLIQTNDENDNWVKQQRELNDTLGPQSTTWTSRPDADYGSPSINC